MSVVLGYSTPGRVSPPSVGASFPKQPATYQDAIGTIVVPPGALDRWYAFRKTKGAARGEIVGFGDSTMAGSGGPYPWLERLRVRAVASGMADGGKGAFAATEQELVYDAPEINGYVSNTGYFDDGGDNFDLYSGAMFYDAGATVGKTITLQFRGSCVRIWYLARQFFGEFTYSIDGSAPVMVDAYSTAGQVPRFAYVSGLDPSVTHTVVITNLASRTASPPTGVAVLGGGSGGSLAAGTYYYKATYVFGGGETLPSTALSATVGAGGQVTIRVPTVQQDSINVYRATSSGGPYQLISPTAGGITGDPPYVPFSDTGGAANPAITPPTVGTTNRNTAHKQSKVALAGMFDNGFTTQRIALTGLLAGFLAGTNWRWPYALGLVDPVDPTAKLDPASYAIDTFPTTAGRVKPVLAIMELGFNDLTSDPTGTPTKLTNAIRQLAAACQVAGCDGLIVSGQLPYNANWPTNGLAAFNAMRNQAAASGLAWADLFYPVENTRSVDYVPSGTPSPHLPKAQYVAQADWLWDNLLGAGG